MSKFWLMIGLVVGLVAVTWSGRANALDRCPDSKTGTINAASPVQSQRLASGTASVCGTTKTTPALQAPAAATHGFDQYALQNRSTAPACVTVSVTATVGSVQSATYLNAFDPTNLQKNYLADGGAIAIVGGGAVTYGVTIPALATFVVTVNELGANASYSLAVTGCGAVVVTSVAPNAGPTAGGTNVTINGSGFLANPTVKIGGTNATNVVLVDQGMITATTPAGAASPPAADVVVTNADATSDTLAGGFTYVPPAGTTVSVTSSKVSSVFGESVTFTANVTSAAGTPNGQVSFFDGVTDIADVALVAGSATFTTSTLVPGTHPITVKYEGNATFAAGTSVGSSRVDLQACKLEYSIVSPK